MKPLTTRLAHLVKNYKNSVEEMEVGIKRQLGLQNQELSKQQHQLPMSNMQHGLQYQGRKEDELSAFKKLVSREILNSLNFPFSNIFWRDAIFQCAASKTFFPLA